MAIRGATSDPIHRASLAMRFLGGGGCPLTPPIGLRRPSRWVFLPDATPAFCVAFLKVCSAGCGPDCFGRVTCPRSRLRVT